MSMMTWRFVSGLAFLAVVICALADETKPFPETSPAVAMRYGRWVDSGPRVIDESGAPLAGVEVTLRRTDPFSRDRFKRVVTAEDGIIPFGAFVTQISYSLEKRGYYPIASRTYGVRSSDRNADVMLRRIERPHPMRTLELALPLPSDTNRIAVAVDLVNGDWLPPYGGGREADAVVTCVVTNIGLRPCCRLNGVDDMWDQAVYSISLRGPDDGLVVTSRTDDELVFPKTAPEAPYDVRTWSAVMSGYRRFDDAVVFRVRGRFGTLLSPEMRFVSDGPRYKAVVTTNEDGSVVCSSVSLPTVTRRTLNLSGCVNVEAGERGLEPSRPVTPSRPVVIPVSADTNLFALGASPDGRVAVFFGRVGAVGAVPEIFERIVYTGRVARDLPDLEVLHVDCSAGEVPSRAFAGLARLRTVVLPSGGRLRIGSGAFAECPDLELVMRGGWGDLSVAADAFVGGRIPPSLVFLDHTPLEWGEADELPGEGCWSRRLVFTESAQLRIPSLRAKADFDRGRVSLPLVFLADDVLYCENDEGDAIFLKRFGHGRTAAFRESTCPR